MINTARIVHNKLLTRSKSKYKYLEAESINTIHSLIYKSSRSRGSSHEVINEGLRGSFHLKSALYWL